MRRALTLRRDGKGDMQPSNRSTIPTAATASGSSHRPVENVSGELGGRLGAPVRLMIKGSSVAEPLRGGASCLIHFPSPCDGQSSSIDITVSAQLGASIKTTQPYVQSPEVRRLLTIAADVRDLVKLSKHAFRFGNLRLEVCIDPSQSCTTPVLSELQALPNSRSIERQSRLRISVGDPGRGAISLAPRLIEAIRDSINHRALQSVTLSTDADGFSLISNVNDPRKVARLPTDLRKLVDSFLLQPGELRTGWFSDGEALFDSPELRARELFMRLLSCDIEDGSELGVRDPLDLSVPNRDLDWNETQVGLIIELANLADEHVRSALLTYLEYFSQLHGTEIYSHSDRLLQVLESNTGCALTALVRDLNAAARELSSKIDDGVSADDEVDATFYQVRFGLNRKLGEDDASVRLRASASRIVSPHISTRLITVVLDLKTLTELLAASTPTDRAVIQFVEGINAEITGRFRNVSNDGTSPPQPPGSIDLKPGQAWFRRVLRDVWSALFGSVRASESRHGGVAREPNLSALLVDADLRSALPVQPRRVVCDPSLLSGTIRFEVSFSRFNGKPNRGAQADIDIKLSPDLVARRDGESDVKGFRSLLTAASALGEITPHYIKFLNARGQYSPPMVFTVSNGLPLSLPYCVQIAEGEGFAVTCSSLFAEILTSEGDYGYSHRLRKGFLDELENVRIVASDPDNRLYDLVLLNGHTARVPFYVREQLVKMAHSLPPALSKSANEIDDSEEGMSDVPTLTELVRACIFGELVSGEELFRRGIERYGRGAIETLIQCLSQQESRPRDLVLVAGWIDGDTKKGRGISHADRLGHLFDIAGLADAREQSPLKAEAQVTNASSVQPSRHHFQFRTLQGHSRSMVSAGRIEERGGRASRLVFVDLDPSTQAALLSAHNLEDYSVKETLARINKQLISLRKSGGGV